MSKNILFIMCDQLRFDYLSCYGHPTLKTPNIDALAKKGMRFTNAYVQSPVCGPSRMSYYTGRYMQSHGSNWNGMPLKVGEKTLGDYLRAVNIKTALVGKTHMRADAEGLARLGIDPNSIIGVHQSECGFDPYERDDGLHGQGIAGYAYPRPRYNDYLKEKGYKGDNPWHDYANSGEENGELASGWAMRNASKPARIKEEDSETPYMTRRAIDFMEENKGLSWCLHLSFIKPHWPYIAPAPYHALYSKSDILPRIAENSARDNNPHPVYKAFMDTPIGSNFSRDDVRDTVIPTYMGLIKQIDDQMGVLFNYMQTAGLMENTLIVFTSDHGDYLGDHWLGEKDLFHQQSVKVPMIIVDPTTKKRGVSHELIEAIDLVPTFLDFAGIEPKDHDHRLEGRSLLPLLRGVKPVSWRKNVISEYDFSMMVIADLLHLEPKDCRLFMVADKRYTFMKSVAYERVMLFDRKTDPQELTDIGDNPKYKRVIAKFEKALAAWALRDHQRTTVSDKQIKMMRNNAPKKGIMIGHWEESELPKEYWQHYQKKAE